jgi:hypothetical protein
MRFPSIIGIVYLVIGLIVASGHAFLAHLTAVLPILSAVLAVVLWPLVLLGRQPPPQLAARKREQAGSTFDPA